MPQDESKLRKRAREILPKLYRSEYRQLKVLYNQMESDTKDSLLERRICAELIRRHPFEFAEIVETLRKKEKEKEPPKMSSVERRHLMGKVHRIALEKLAERYGPEYDALYEAETNKSRKSRALGALYRRHPEEFREIYRQIRKEMLPYVREPED